MLKGKTIQMDEKMISSVEKKMVADRNFSFQAVTREYIEIGIAAEKAVKNLVALYQIGRHSGPENFSEEAEAVEELLFKIIPRDFADIRDKVEKRKLINSGQ